MVIPPPREFSHSLSHFFSFPILVLFLVFVVGLVFFNCDLCFSFCFIVDLPLHRGQCNLNVGDVFIFSYFVSPSF